MVYTILSPTPLSPTFPEPISWKAAILVASKLLDISTNVSVGSSVVFESLSIPSSLVSETVLEVTWVLPTTTKVFDTLPELAAPDEIWYEAEYVTMPSTFNDEEVDPAVPETKVGAEVKVRAFPLPSLKLSLNVKELMDTFPLFSTVIV